MQRCPTWSRHASTTAEQLGQLGQRQVRKVLLATTGKRYLPSSQASGYASLKEWQALVQVQVQAAEGTRRYRPSNQASGYASQTGQEALVQVLLATTAKRYRPSNQASGYASQTGQQVSEVSLAAIGMGEERPMYHPSNLERGCGQS
jgi:hypothetical protein